MGGDLRQRRTRREYLLKRGVNPIPIDTFAVRTLRFRLTRIDGTQLLLGAGGIPEISIPGVTPIRETLVLPALLRSRPAT